MALTLHVRPVPGVRIIRYAVEPLPRSSDIPALRDFETKVARGIACANAMRQLRDGGFMPDVIVAHTGWGEALFCKDVWPASRFLVFSEFYYGEGGDAGFDPEFSTASDTFLWQLRVKNTALLHGLAAADGGYAPTHWQHSRLPHEFRPKVKVMFDGVDTQLATPRPEAWVHLQRQNLRLAAGDEVITFVNRNLEPYRGFHIFMRALPEILERRPHAHVLLVGGDDISYGGRPAEGVTWRQRLLAEVGHRLPMERVHFLGKVPYDRYLALLQVSACHVYLTYPFVLSWSCVEALAAGCVVVAGKTAPVEEVIDHGQNGLLVDFFDIAGLAEQVVNVLAQPEQFAAMRAEARRSAVELYDLRSVCLPRLLHLVTSHET